MDNVRDQLLEEGQALIQKHGYNGFSFRDLAATVGIKSASIHYHFPTKADLGAAVTERYTQQFMDSLADMEGRDTDPGNNLKFFASLFRDTLIQDHRMCLCGILGAEANTLPAIVRTEARQFFEQCIVWLTRVFERLHAGTGDDHSVSPKSRAAEFMATLEGGLILAKGLDDLDTFDQIVETVLVR